MKKLFEKYGKKKVYFTALGIAVALSLVVVAVSMFLGNNTVKLAVENQVVEYGENPYDVKLEKVIKDYDKLVKNKKLKDVQLSLVQDKKEIKKSDITKEKLLPVGKYVLNITSGEEVKLALDVEVKDTVAPKFVDFKKDIKIEQNAKDVKLESYFKAEDLSETKITTKGEVKLEETGKYEISVTATDKYKNATTNKATIEVVSMETAESEGVSETAEGTKPISSELATKKEQAVKEQQQAEEQEIANPAPVVTPPVTNNQVGATTPTAEPQPPVETSPILCPGGWYPEKACDVFIDHPSMIPTDGIYYDSMEEANAAGEAYVKAYLAAHPNSASGYDSMSVEFNGYTKYIFIQHDPSLYS